MRKQITGKTRMNAAAKSASRYALSRLRPGICRRSEAASATLKEDPRYESKKEEEERAI